MCFLTLIIRQNFLYSEKNAAILYGNDRPSDDQFLTGSKQHGARAKKWNAEKARNKKFGNAIKRR